MTEPDPGPPAVFCVVCATAWEPQAIPRSWTVTSKGLTVCSDCLRSSWQGERSIQKRYPQQTQPCRTQPSKTSTPEESIT